MEPLGTHMQVVQVEGEELNKGDGTGKLPVLILHEDDWDVNVP